MIIRGAWPDSVRIKGIYSARGREPIECEIVESIQGLRSRSPEIIAVLRHPP